MEGSLKELAQKVLNVYRFNKGNFRKIDQQSERSMRYVLQKQWTDNEESAADAANKPHLTYNMLLATLNILEGQEELTRRRVKFKSTAGKLDKAVEIAQGRWNALNDEQDIEESLQVAFLDSLIKPKGGWIERRIEMTKEGYLDFKYRVADGMLVHPDQEWKAYDFKMETCKNLVKETWETLATIKDKYDFKDAADKTKRAWYYSLYETIRAYAQRLATTSTFGYDKRNDRYMILELQERTKKKVFTIYDEGTGQYHYVDPSDWDTLRTQNPYLKKVLSDTIDAIHITTIIPYFDNKIVVDEDSRYPSKNFDLFPMLSYRFNAQVNETVSLIDVLLDLQDDLNKGMSQKRDYITQGVSGPYLWSYRDKDAMENVQRLGNAPNVHVAIRDPKSFPMRMQPDRIPPEIFQNNAEAVALTKELSQTPAATRATSEKSGESGLLFKEKLAAAGAAVNPFYKNLSMLRKNLAEDYLDNLSYVYAEQDRIISIKNSQGQLQEEIVNLNIAGQVFNDLANPSMSVELDNGEDNVTAREENFNKLFALYQSVLQVNPQKAAAMLDAIIPMAPVNGIDQLMERMKKIDRQQARVGQEAAQLESEKTQAEIEKDKAMAELDHAKAQNEYKGQQV